MSPGRPGLPSPALPVCVSPLASPRSHSSSSDTINTSTESLELSDSEDEVQQQQAVVPIQATVPAIKRKSDDDQFLSSSITGEKIPAAEEHKKVRLLDPSGESVDEEGDEQISQDQSEKVHGAWRRQHLQTKAANAKRKKTATRRRRRKTVSCKLCSKVLCDKSSLSAHMASKHGISGSRKADADPSSSEDNLLCARNLLRGVACGACLRHAEKLSLCSGCHTVSYCGTKCQSHNWSRHKKVCKLMKDAKEEEKLSFLAKEIQWFKANQKRSKNSCQLCRRVVKDGVNCGRCSNVVWHKYCFKQLARTEDVMCGDCCVVVEGPSDLPGRKGSEVTRAVDLHPLRAALPLPTSRLPTVGDVLRCANLRRENSTLSQYTDRMLARDVAR